MIDIKLIKEHRDIVEAAIKNKHAAAVDLDRILSLYEERRGLLEKITNLNTEKNKAAAARNIEAGRMVKEDLQKTEERLREVMKEFIALMSLIPNIPSVDTPIGKDETENKVIRTWGEKPQFNFKPKEHFEIGANLFLIDNERAAKVTGSRFTYLKGDLVLLQFGMIQLVLETLTNKAMLEEIAKHAGITELRITPFIPVIPPVMIRPDIFQAMGRLEPKEERYHIPSDDLYLVGSAEHTIGPMYAEEILHEDELPIRYIGYSTAFRREAGSYGKDTKGILRMHQFDKLEMESFTIPEHSMMEQDFLVAIQEYIMRRLNIPYQVVLVCTGDMGGPDQRQIDIEAWLPGQNKYRETHSADLIGAYQPRRLNTRVKRREGGVEFLHMNDATAIAIGRMLIAIMENNQRENGTIYVPEALQKYVGKAVIGEFVP